MLAKQVVIGIGEGRENEKEFNQLLQEFVSQLTPHGPIERMLVELIAICYWRYMRFLRAEKGEIIKNTALLLSQIKDENVKEYQISRLIPSNTYGIPETIDNVLILRDVIKFLADAEEELKSLCYISETTLKIMTCYLGCEKGSLSVLCMLHNKEFKEQAEFFIDEDKDPNKIPEIQSIIELILKRFGQEKKRVEVHLKRIEEREDTELKSQSLCLNVPPAEIMDRFIRYEASILRQLYKAINELERIQRKRLGELVPPPLNIEVGMDKNSIAKQTEIPISLCDTERCVSLLFSIKPFLAVLNL